MRLPRVKAPRVVDRFPQEVQQENRRLSGITPRMLGQFPESPARYLPQAHGLKGLARARKVGSK